MSKIPSIEDLVEQFTEGGWSALEAATDRNKADRAQREAKQRAIADDVLWLVRQAEGRRVMEFILDNSLRRASWHGDLRFSIEQSASYGLMREGQNSIAAMLIAALREATGGDVSILTSRDHVDDRARTTYRAAVLRWFRHAARRIVGRAHRT